VNGIIKKHWKYYEKNTMDNKLLREKIRLVWTIILLAILVVFLLTGCKTETVLVPVEKVKIEYRDRLRIDSVYNRDTVNIYERGDTVYLQTIKWRERFKFDTVIVVRTDSIPYPVEVVREINKLTKWQKFRLNALNILVLIIAAYLFIKIKLS
jgi:hypothetical protein